MDWFASNDCDSAPVPDGASCNSALIDPSWDIDTEPLVYPNLTSGLLSIELNAHNETKVKVVVTDVLGSVKYAKESNLVRGENVIDIDIIQLINGTYFIKIRSASVERIASVILINK